MTGEVGGAAQRWHEHIETDADVLALRRRLAGVGLPGAASLPGLWPDAEALSLLMRYLATDAGLESLALPEGVRLRRPGDFVFAFNYETEP